MPNIKTFPALFAALSLSVGSSHAQADEDWLVARANGQWTWESAGPEGRVHKNFLHQEVLRRGEGGQVVVVSALPITEGDTVSCSESARRNPKDACSSGFLVCQASGGKFASLLGGIMHGAKGATDSRNSYRCSIDADAVLEAAHAIGMIERIEPKTAARKSPDPAASPDTP